MSDRLEALRLFSAVARAGSFSAAAEKLRLSQSTASRMIADLERRLGASLLLRSTRAVRLTEAGRRYLDDIDPVLAALARADDAVAGTDELAGELRIGVSSANATHQVLPVLETFLAAHPKLSVTLVVDDRRQDLLNERVDVALRFGALPDAAMRAQRIGVWPLLVSASPDYLDRHPPIAHPADLASHAFIVAGPLADRPVTFSRGDERHDTHVAGRLSVTSSAVAVAAGIHGLGLIASSASAVDAELASGVLVQVLHDWSIGDLVAHAVFPVAQPPQRAARAFVDHLVAFLRTYRASVS